MNKFEFCLKVVVLLFRPIDLIEKSHSVSFRYCTPLTETVLEAGNAVSVNGVQYRNDAE